ncbi:unnamed protein product [Bemisia tabaci]|uniref:Anoctamin n=1 Tax=Bemisia tabaci TaxID=7038 RepID=A0A9P0F0M9_BEMTA|nr:unnamed protein product [Bemisia tabaci]
MEGTQGSSDNAPNNEGIFSCARGTLESASRLLRRKIPRAGHLMTPRRLWIQTVPTQECDVVIILPPHSEDAVLMWLLTKLRAPSLGLIVHVKLHSSTESYSLYLTAPYTVLLKYAEELHLPKRLRQEVGGGLKEFTQSEANSFEGTENEGSFFTTQERQWLVFHLLQTIRASADEDIGKTKFIVGQAIIPKCLSTGIISQVFPLHDMPTLKNLRTSWVQAFFEAQPIDQVCEYFGVKIAMYFAWLGYYNTALIVPAVVGFIFWIGLFRGDQVREDIGFVLFSFFNVLWFSIYFEAWKRYSAELAYKWGTLDQRDELLMEPRPLFRGTLEVSPVTGRLEPFYPTWKRNLFRYLISAPIIGVCLIIVFIVMILNFKLQDWWDKVIAEKGYTFYLSYLPKVLLAVIISILDEAYFTVAKWLNDVENYRLETKYENNLIIKVALFQFVNSFLSLFYIAFYLQDQERLKEQLATLLITRQFIGNLKESALPYLLEQFRLAKLSFDLFGALSPTEAKAQTEPQFDEVTDPDSKKQQSKPTSNRSRTVSQAELECSLFKYDGTFADHLEMFIQLGYVVLFSSAFPLAAICAFVNNLIEIRSDAFKLCFIFQRPFGQRVPNIGMWQHAMEVMGLIAVLVNCALIGLSGQVHRMFPEMSTTQTILLIVALEHIMLILRFFISCGIPDLPDWIATEIAKVEFARREALSRLSSTAHTPGPTPPSSALSIGRFMVSQSSNGEESEKQMKEAGSASCSHSSTPKDEAKPCSLSSTPPKGKDHKPKMTISKIPPFKQKLSMPSETVSAPSSAVPKDWPLNDGEDQTYHMTIGTHSGADFVKRLGLDSKSSPLRKIIDTDKSMHKSTECLPTAQKKAGSSESDSQRMPWSPGSRQQKFLFHPQKNEPEITPAPMDPDAIAAAESAAKKQRLKQTLVKRARSVAIFSLKLKEKRAKEAEKLEKAKEKEREKSIPKVVDNLLVGGELSCIPLEKLILVDDVATGGGTMKKRGSSSSTGGSSSSSQKP